MQDPKPENIAGTKQVVHKVEHQVNWGHVALAIGALAVAYVGYSVVSGTSTSTEEDDFEVMGG